MLKRSKCRVNVPNRTIEEVVTIPPLTVPEQPWYYFKVVSVSPIGPFISLSVYRLRNRIREGVLKSILFLSLRSYFLDFSKASVQLSMLYQFSSLLRITSQNFSTAQAPTLILKIPVFRSLFPTMKVSVFRIINRRMTIDAIWSCYLPHLN